MRACQGRHARADRILQAIDRGECLLEWEGEESEAPTDKLLKNKFSSERRKAKVRSERGERRLHAADPPSCPRSSTFRSPTARRSTG